MEKKTAPVDMVNNVNISHCLTGFLYCFIYPNGGLALGFKTINSIIMVVAKASFHRFAKMT